MKYCYIILTTVLLLPLFSKAQSNYQPGYVVNLKGDTLKGLIDRKEWGKNPDQFSFKTDLNSKRSDKYDTDNALAAGVINAENYRLYTLRISNDQTDESHLSTGIDTITTPRTLFLRILTIGKSLSLFVYQDNTKERFFIAEKDQQPVELSYHVYLDAERSTIVRTTNFRRKLLGLAMQLQPNNKELADVIQRTDYSQKALKQVVNDINGGGKQPDEGSERDGSAFFVGVGANYATASGGGGTALANGGRSSSTLPVIDLGWDIYFNKSVKKVIFRADLAATAMNANFSGEGYANSKYIQTLKFKRYTASLTPQIIVNLYNSDKFKFYIGGGAILSHNIYTDKQNRIVYYIGEEAVSQIDPDFPSMKGIMVQMTGKAGFFINNTFEIFTSYSSSSLNENTGYSVNSTSYQAGIHYFFGHK